VRRSAGEADCESHVQLLVRATDVQMCRHRREGPELTELHRPDGTETWSG